MKFHYQSKNIQYSLKEKKKSSPVGRNKRVAALLNLVQRKIIIQCINSAIIFEVFEAGQNADICIYYI